MNERELKSFRYRLEKRILADKSTGILDPKPRIPKKKPEDIPRIPSQAAALTMYDDIAETIAVHGSNLPSEKAVDKLFEIYLREFWSKQKLDRDTLRRMRKAFKMGYYICKNLLTEVKMNNSKLGQKGILVRELEKR